MIFLSTFKMSQESNVYRNVFISYLSDVLYVGILVEYCEALSIWDATVVIMVKMCPRYFLLLYRTCFSRIIP